MSAHRRSRGYLDELAQRAATGLSRVPERFRSRHLRYILGAQNADGGFSGRDGGSDLYYTSFALRAAELLAGSEADEPWANAAAWLSQRGPHAGDIVDGFCLLHCRQLLTARGLRPWAPDVDALAVRGVEAALERHHTPDGGYAKSLGGQGSVYHTFLAALCCQFLGRDVPSPERAAAFVRTRQCPDGGFADIEGAEGGTNPTAAAIGLLAAVGALDQATGTAAARFLAAMQRPDGGFAAHRAAPVSDLMSTFTALVTLAEAGATRFVKRSAAARFVQARAAAAGGFHATAGHDEADVEYTYYGLATVGLLASRASCTCKDERTRP